MNLGWTRAHDRSAPSTSRQLALMGIATILALVTVASSAAQREEDTVEAATRALKALRHGGFVVVLSPGETASDEEDVDDPRHPRNCGAQRSLTDVGRLNASGIGKVLARQGIPVGLVLSSHYCRAIETAERMALHAHARTLERRDVLNDAARVTGDDSRRRASALRLIAGEVPVATTNVFVVTHRQNIAAAFGPSLLDVEDAELVIIRPTPYAAHRYELVHRLTVRVLSALVHAQGRPSSAKS